MGEIENDDMAVFSTLDFLSQNELENQPQTVIYYYHHNHVSVLK